MTTIYFDESGDLGFDFSKARTTKVFSIAFLLVENKRSVSKLVKNVYKTHASSILKNGSGVLHARYESPSIIKRLLRGLVAKDVRIAIMRLDKRNVYIAENPNELYTNIVISLINKLYADGIINSSEQIELIASRRNTSRFLNERFSENIINNVVGRKLSVSIVKPSDDKCLQAADFVSWSFWQKYAYSDNTYVDIIADKVIQEYEMY